MKILLTGYNSYCAIDATKLEIEIKWEENENFNSGIVKTIDRHLRKYGVAS